MLTLSLLTFASCGARRWALSPSQTRWGGRAEKLFLHLLHPDLGFLPVKVCREHQLHAQVA